MCVVCEVEFCGFLIVLLGFFSCSLCFHFHVCYSLLGLKEKHKKLKKGEDYTL
jgi:hypothetical protein